MDYMSENSNISISAKSPIPEDRKDAIIPQHFIPSVSHFIPKCIPPSSAKNVAVQDGVNADSNTTSQEISPRRLKLKVKNPTKSPEDDNRRKISMNPKTKTSISVNPTSDGRSSHLLFVNGGDYSTRHVDSSENLLHGHVTQVSSEPSEEHRALYLPRFRDIKTCMWTASHAANSPSEDRSASLVNLLLQPLPPNFDSETQLMPLEPDYKVLIRLNLWAVIDGHGGGCVATYGSEVLLPHIAASVSRALGCAIVDRGVCTVNGQLRDANALDLDGLIQNQSDRYVGNPNSIHYRSPYERSDSDGDDDEEDRCDLTNDDAETAVPATLRERKRMKNVLSAAGKLLSGSIGMKQKQKNQQKKNNQEQHLPHSSGVDASMSSIKTSVKTAASAPIGEEALAGTHSPREVATITRAITESFLAVDEAWINSIDPVATHQTSCQSNGRWNSGACALVVFTVQRLVWTSISEPDREKESMKPEKNRRNTNQNRDAARRRMLDYASRAKSACSMSTVSSTSSLTTEEAVHSSGIESEITETEGEDDDRSFEEDTRKRDSVCLTRSKEKLENVSSLISPPGGCSCHCYRAHSAMIYTAHVGDCRAVMLGSAPPRTIKVGDFSSLHQDMTDDESSHHSSDETECLSSSDHDADSSEEEEIETIDANSKSTATSSFMNFPKRVARLRQSGRRGNNDISGPFTPLPPLAVSSQQSRRKTFEVDFEHDVKHQRVDSGRKQQRIEPSDSSSETSQDSIEVLPLIHLPPVTRPIDLTTDHSAYNPAEVTAVLRRCNNAPKAISAGVGGGIKRVAGSLAVTRALGDAYLKTPLLSFLPYKSHAPYITARPEVNCRQLLKNGDKVLILATDGVWERASGDDVLRWVRNFYEERLAEANRRANRRAHNANNVDKSQSSSDEDCNDTLGDSNNKSNTLFYQQEGSERDLFDPAEVSMNTNTSSRKRDIGSMSPPGTTNMNATVSQQVLCTSAVKRRRRSRYNNSDHPPISYNVADVIVRRVLNKVRRARNISSLQALMSLPPGRARRSKHDDITASVIDLSAFVS